MDKPDRRVEKTKVAIYQALSELLNRKRYPNITIQEIIDRANVGRTTFYSHFSTKDDLLYSCIENVFESFNAHLMNDASQAHETHLIPVAELFEHIQENSRMVKGILALEGGELLSEKLKNYWSVKIEPYLLLQIPNGKEPRVPIPILTNYITSTVFELLRWWMKSGMSYTPQQMEQYLFELVSPSISNGLTGSPKTL